MRGLPPFKGGLLSISAVRHGRTSLLVLTSKERTALSRDDKHFQDRSVELQIPRLHSGLFSRMTSFTKRNGTSFTLLREQSERRRSSEGWAGRRWKCARRGGSLSSRRVLGPS